MYKKIIIFVVAVFLLGLGLTNFNRIRESIFGARGIMQKGTDVPCINSNLPLAYHIHPILKIVEYGKNVPIPQNIGLEGSCERVLHTHEDSVSGIIHVESNVVKDYVL